MSDGLITRVLRPIQPYYLHYIWTPKAKPIARRICPVFIKKSDTVVEVGANFGGLTLLLSDLALEVYSLERSPKTFKYLKRFVKNRKNVKVFCVAASSEDGFTVLRTDDAGLSEEASIREGNPEANLTTGVMVPTARLDSMNFEHPPTCLVLDCEGAEEDVLRGAMHLLRASVNTVLVEIHRTKEGTTEEPILDILERSEFRVKKDDYWLLAKRMSPLS
jgi:FkbM family methyltransferase